MIDLPIIVRSSGIFSAVFLTFPQWQGASCTLTPRFATPVQYSAHLIVLNSATMKSLKSILVWILLFALPLQGFAAVSMSLCDMGIPTVAVAASAAAGHASPAMPEGCEHHNAAQAPGDDSAGSMAKCSTCASCSVGAAIAAALIRLPEVTSHGAKRIPYVAAHDTACVYGALERPPHSVA